MGPLATLAVLVAGLGIAIWAPWQSKTHERELAWLRVLNGWIEAAAQRPAVPAACRARFDRVVGPPPSKRLQPAAEIAHDGCRGSEFADGWPEVEWRIRSNLIDSRFAAADTTAEPSLASAVRSVAGQVVHVNCWPGDSWRQLNDEWATLAPGEFWGAIGLADPPRRAIHLAPEICQPLRRFLGSSYRPYLNQQSFDLAEALDTLVHEGEHVRHPYASEATVECYAMQDVRDLVLHAGRGPNYASEMAGLVWEIGYPLLPAEYQTRDCRNGGRLDRHPRSRIWP